MRKHVRQHFISWKKWATKSGIRLFSSRLCWQFSFPDMLLNETAVLLPYAGVRLTANKYFENAITLRKTEVREMLAKTRKLPDRDLWPSPAVVVDAFHYFTGNEISWYPFYAVTFFSFPRGNFTIPNVRAGCPCLCQLWSHWYGNWAWNKSWLWWFGYV